MANVRFNPDGLALSEHYAETMNDVVLPYINARRSEAHVTGDGGRSLFVSRFDAGHASGATGPTGAARSIGTVLIVHGFTENVDKFDEVIHALLRSGYGVVAYDQRGHGRSWHAEGLADPSLTHVDDFDEYVRDMEAVVDQVLSAMPKPWYLLAHSMGGAVSALYLERHADVFARAALCSPMIAASLGGLPAPLARVICGAGARLIGRKKRVFVSKPYAGPEAFEGSAASGRARFDWYEAVRAGTPAFQNNGPSYGWMLQALRVTGMILADGAVERIATPTRVYTAGDDTVVLPEAQQAFAARLKHGERVVVPGARHEIYRSTDDVLFPWWHGILEFYQGKG